MKIEELEKFHHFLKEHIPGYVSMIIDGSVAVGDTWVPGESDYDVLLIFESDYRKYIKFIREFLKASSFDDEYLFVPFLKDDYVRSMPIRVTSYFRTKVLFGEDVTQEAELPSRENAEETFSAGLRTVCSALEHRLMSTEFWSEDKVKKTFHIYFKRALMYLAIREYAKTGTYPRTRRETAEVLNAPAVTDTLRALEDRDNLSKEEIIGIVEGLIEYLKSS